MWFSRRFNSIVLAVVSAPLVAGPAWGQFPDNEKFPVSGAPPQVAQAQPPPPPGINPPPGLNPPSVTPTAQAKSEDGVEVLTSGPIHEAFAGPLVLDPKPGVIVKKEPPQAVEELPPEQRPEGTDVEWISGYWQWDDQRDNFVWISGIWRDIPQGRRWVVGYWAKIDDGWQRTSGFWAGADVQEVEYVEEAPPETLEAGPNIAAPSENHFWVPGNWIYRDVRHVWRPGFWHVAYPDWVWCPSYWHWTPSGYVMTSGYWDYPIVRRGVCFSPVYYHEPIYTYPNYYWTPNVCFDYGALSLHLFARPRYQHYYCGDYYGSHWRGHGFQIWFDFHRHRGHYDPHFVHSRWYHHHHRGNRHWERNLHSRHEHFVNNVDARPARNFRDQVARRDRGLTPADAIVGQRIGDLANNRESPVRLANIDRKTREDVAARSRQWRDFQRDRRELEVGNRIPVNRVVDGSRGRRDGESRERGPGDRERGDRGPGDVARPDRKAPDGGRVTRERPRFKLPENSLGVSKRPLAGGDVAKTGGAPNRPGDGAGNRRGDDRPGRDDRQPRPRTGDDAVNKLPATRQPRPSTPDRPDLVRPRPDRPGGNRPNVDRPNVDRPNVERPNVERPQPKVERPQPRIERPRPESPPRVESPRPPRVERPGPPAVDRTPRRAPETPRERPDRGGPDRGRADRAGAVIDRPIPQRPSPQPRVERPVPPPRTERPAPRVERPAPRVERPAPRAERPAPRVERPAPRVERPAPRVERPAPQRAPVARATPSRPPAPRPSPPPSRPAPSRPAPSRPAPSRPPAAQRPAPSRPAPSREDSRDRRRRDR